jgi:beta-alanine degradation protein BauB
MAGSDPKIAAPLSEANVTTNVGTDVIFENEVVRVWRMKLAPGESSDVHVHRFDHAFVYANRSLMEVTFADGSTLRQPSDEGLVYYREVGDEGLPKHQLTNVGYTDSIHYIFEFLGKSRSRDAQDGQNNGRFIEGFESDL